MSLTTPSLNLGLPVPNLNDPGPDYASNVNTCLNGLDAAIGGAVTGIGTAKVDLSAQPTSGNISADGYNFSNARSIQFLNQSGALIGSQDVNCLYVNSEAIGWNDSNGVFHALTGGGSGGGGGLTYVTSFTASNLTILPTATYNWINVNTSSSPVTVQLPVIATLPSGSSGRFFYFNDQNGTFGTHPLSIMVQGSSGNVLLYNGANAYGVSTINWQGGAALAYTDGNNTWYVIPLNQMYFNADNIVYSNSNVQMNSTSLIMDGTSGLSLPGTITNNNASSFTPQLVAPINIVSGGSVDGQVNANIATAIMLNAAGSLQVTVADGMQVNPSSSVEVKSGGSIQFDPGSSITGVIGFDGASVQNFLGSTRFNNHPTFYGGATFNNSSSNADVSVTSYTIELEPVNSLTMRAPSNSGASWIEIDGSVLFGPLAGNGNVVTSSNPVVVNNSLTVHGVINSGYVLLSESIWGGDNYTDTTGSNCFQIGGEIGRQLNLFLPSRTGGPIIIDCSNATFYADNWIKVNIVGGSGSPVTITTVSAPNCIVEVTVPNTKTFAAPNQLITLYCDGGAQLYVGSVS